MPVIFKNNATSILPNPVDNSQTTIAVSPGDGGKFPSLTVGNWFPVTMKRPDGTMEICRCTERAGDVLTVVRGEENTVPVSFAVGDIISLRLTENAIAEIFTASEREKLAGIENNATQDMAPAEILAAIKTVDGAGSGLTADTVDGKHASDMLDVNGTAVNADRLDNKLPSTYLNTSGGTWGGNHTFTGSVATGTFTANGNATINGSLTATGNVTAYSDKRLKHNIMEIGSALDRLLMIRGVVYDRTDCDEKGAGLIAQEVKQAFPRAVKEGANQMLSVDIMGVLGLLVNAVKELKEQVDRHG